MAQRGGKREGAGRKLSSATLETQKQREAFLKLLKPQIKALFSVLMAKALEGDVPAIREVFDRAWGKAAQPIANDGDKPFMVAGVEIAVRK